MTGEVRPNGWVGIDLDGTLARYDGWKGIHYIGEPIPNMVEYVKHLLDQGVPVKIMTARCQEGIEAIQAVQRWCVKNLGLVLPVTDKKDFGMVWLVDDRAVTVRHNTGEFLVMAPEVELVFEHWNEKKGAPKAEVFNHE